MSFSMGLKKKLQKEKKYIGVVNLKSLFVKSSIFLNSKSAILFSPSFDGLALNTDLYILLKELKKLKSAQCNELVDVSSSNLVLHLQSSKIFSSLIEKENIFFCKNLNKKLESLQIYEKVETNSSFFLDSALSPVVFVDNNFGGFTPFSNTNFFKEDSKSNKLLSFLKRKEFYNQVYKTRYFSHINTFRKKYRFLSSSLKSNRLRISSIFGVYSSCFLKYVKDKDQAQSLLKKLIWRRKKRKRRKWKNSFIFRFFRSRHRLFYKFYIPKYFEINYKTFSLFHLGLVDVSSVNPRISFWINLRRLLTFITF